MGMLIVDYSCCQLSNHNSLALIHTLLWRCGLPMNLTQIYNTEQSGGLLRELRVGLAAAAFHVFLSVQNLRRYLVPNQFENSKDSFIIL